jgi:hypothetical protein
MLYSRPMTYDAIYNQFDEDVPFTNDSPWKPMARCANSPAVPAVSPFL